MRNFHECAYNRFSQNGEDGILEELLKQLDIDHGFFVEFGAWDGKYLSNSYNLQLKGWRGCYIEGDIGRFEELKRNFGGESDVTLVNAYIESKGEKSLDRILEKASIESIDLLSIDIDGDDLSVWRSVERYLPAVLIIEYNPTIPFDTEFVNPAGESIGNSALSIKNVSEEKGYVLVEATQTNLIFVN